MSTETLVADPPITTHVKDQLHTVTPLDLLPDKPDKPFTYHEFTFPPFPAIPAGVTIIPFSEFKEKGIAIEAGPDGDEIDSLGIPTVPMTTRHWNDECKTKATKRKAQWDSKGKKKKRHANGQAGPALTWWEEWTMGEMTRYGTSHDPNTSRFDRLQAGCADFTEKRQWPAIARAETGPKYVWEKFRRFIGVSDIVRQESATRRKKRRKMFGPDTDDSDSDDGLESGDERGAPRDAEDNADDEASAPPADEQPRPASKQNGIIDPDVLLYERAMRKNQEKMYAFFEDPEKSFKIFMSSHGRRIGLYWSDDNLEIIPRLLRFFVEFILRSNVLPEIARELKRCITILDSALEEMPATSTISKAMPDKFSMACRGSWGKKTETLYFGGDDWGSTTETANEPAPAPFAAPPVEEVNYSSGWGEEGNNTQDTAGTVQDNATSANLASSDNNDGWGSNGWEIDVNGENTDDNPWGNLEGDAKDVDSLLNTDAQDGDMWTPAIEDNIISLLGPTTFLLTHKAGVVERSFRLIKEVIPPPANIPPEPVQAQFALDSPAVETLLERRFTKLVLGPSEIGWDGGEAPVYTRPEILSTSQGPVVTSGVSDGSPPAEATPGGTPPHNPLTDSITVLVETDSPYVNHLKPGMGFGGTWVQIARDVLPKKKKGKKLKPAPSLWYISELNMVIPSFWTIPDASNAT